MTNPTRRGRTFSNIDPRKQRLKSLKAIQRDSACKDKAMKACTTKRTPSTNLSDIIDVISYMDSEETLSSDRACPWTTDGYGV